MLASRDIAVRRALASTDFQFADRGKKSQVTGDVETWIASGQYWFVEAGARLERPPIGTLGDRIAVFHVTMSGAPGEVEFVFESLVLIETDPAGKMRAFMVFDPDDRAAVFAEAESRFAAGEAGDARAAQASVAAHTHALAERDWAGLQACFADDAVIVDRRTIGLGRLDRDKWLWLLGWNRHGRVGITRSFGSASDSFYFNDAGSLAALRFNQWKLVFAEQRSHGFEVWQDPFVTLRLPKLFNIRSDPFETADHESMDYERWRLERLFLLVPAQQYVGRFLSTFKEYPPRQKAGSFGIDQVLNTLTSNMTTN